MRMRMGGMVFCGWMAAAGMAAASAGDVVTIALRDGSRLVGTIVAEDASSVTIAMAGGAEVTVPVASIISRDRGREDDAGTAPPSDPNYSRLLFAPTARPLGRGEGYVADHEVLFPGVAFGITDNISLSGGLSVIPSLGLSEQVFYISPKVGFDLSDRASVAAGALVAIGGGGDFDDRESARIGFAVGTFGSRRHNFTVGAGIGDTSSEFSDAVPILMAGGTTTLSRHVALVGETWMFLGDDFRLSEQPFGVGVRLFNDRLSADLGVILIGELLDQGFPIPWVSVSYHFGKRR